MKYLKGARSLTKHLLVIGSIQSVGVTACNVLAAAPEPPGVGEKTSTEQVHARLFLSTGNMIGGVFSFIYAVFVLGKWWGGR